MRRLLWIPDIHSPQEAGPDFYTSRKFESFIDEGKTDANRHLELVIDAVAGSNLDFASMRFFGEGIAASGMALQGEYFNIFPGILADKTENFLLHRRAVVTAQKLVDLVGSETEEDWSNPVFLQEVRDALKDSDEANNKREAEIIKNINTRLRNGETGILILGAGHYLMLDKLDGDIVVELFDARFEAIVEESRELHRELHEVEGGNVSAMKERGVGITK